VQATHGPLVTLATAFLFLWILYPLSLPTWRIRITASAEQIAIRLDDIVHHYVTSPSGGNPEHIRLEGDADSVAEKYETRFEWMADDRFTAHLQHFGHSEAFKAFRNEPKLWVISRKGETDQLTTRASFALDGSVRCTGKNTANTTLPTINGSAA
jgi:hypothetical protein